MDWANENAICCENGISNVFRYEERPTTVVWISSDTAVRVPYWKLLHITDIEARNN
jgi:hypothetical protein